MLTGERAADFHAVANDFGGGLHGALELAFVARIVKDDWVKVAVAGVENVADVETVARANLADAAKSLRKFRAGNHAVEDVVAGGEAAESTESVFAALPKEFAFGVVAGEANFAGVVLVANLGDGDGLSGYGFGEAFDFEKKNGGAVAREASVDKVFDDAERPAIEHFAGGGRDAVRGDVGDSVGGFIDGIENGEERFDRFGLAREFNGDFRDERERAFGADEKAGEIVAGSIAVFTADARNFAVGENEFESGNVIRSDSVGKCVRTSGIFRDVAADGAGFPTGRIGREVETVRFGSAREFEIDDAGLHSGAAIFWIDFENAIHARKDQHDAAAAGERPAGESSACAATDDGDVVLCGEFDNPGDLLSRLRKNDGVGTRFFNGAIVFVEKKIFGDRKYSVTAEKIFEFADERGVHNALGKCARAL